MGVPPIIHRRAADALFVVYLFYLQISMTKKRSSENFQDRTKFFRECLKELLLRQRHDAAADFLGPAARRRRPKLTGAPPPTQLRRRTALCIMAMNKMKHATLATTKCL